MAHLNVMLNSQRKGSDGKCQVVLYVSVGGKRARYVFPFRVEPERWDTRKKSVKPGGNAPHFNRTIQDTLSRAEVLGLDQSLTAERIVAALSGPTAAGTRLSEAIAVVLKERASRFKPQTLDRLGHIVALVQASIPLATLEGLSPAEVHKYREHVHARGVGQNTLRSRLKLLRILYRHACSHYGVTPRDLFLGVLPAELPTEPRFLSPSEIDALERWEGQGSDLLARDAFLLALYLGGMRFGDLVELRSEQVSGSVLNVRQRKTGAIVALPIVEKARAIIDRHRGGEKVLPLLTNQQTNEALKRVAAAAGVNRKLSMHWARHGFTAWAVRAGVNMPVISTILGHSSTTTTQKYLARFDRSAVEEAMKKVFG